MRRPNTALLIAAACLVSSPAAADEVADFYAKTELRIMIGNPPGPGYDGYARTLGRYMAKHLPGKPTIVAMNRPGAGSLVLMNELYTTLPKDGSVIAGVNRNVLTEPLFGNEQAKFDARRFNWIGSMNNEVSVCGAWHTTGVKTFADMRTRGLVTGGTSAGDDTVVFPNVLNNLLGTKIKSVSGYTGAVDINLAIERGEIEGRCGMSYSQLTSVNKSWMDEKKFTILLQLSTTKHADLKDVPLVTEIASPEQAQALSLIFARQFWGRPFAAPPGVPPTRVAALRKAFIDTMNDPEFKAEAAKQRMEVNAVDGTTMQTLLAKLYDTPKETIDAARRATMPPQQAPAEKK